MEVVDGDARCTWSLSISDDGDECCTWALTISGSEPATRSFDPLPNSKWFRFNFEFGLEVETIKWVQEDLGLTCPPSRELVGVSVNADFFSYYHIRQLLEETLLPLSIPEEDRTGVVTYALEKAYAAFYGDYTGVVEDYTAFDFQFQLLLERQLIPMDQDY